MDPLLQSLARGFENCNLQITTFFFLSQRGVNDRVSNIYLLSFLLGLVPLFNTTQAESPQAKTAC